MKRSISYLPIIIIVFGIFFLNASPAQAATLYYNNATFDSDWNTLGNWWTDAGFTTPAGAIPGVVDDVIIEGDVFSNSGGAVSVNTITVNNTFALTISATVASGATFNDSSFFAVGTITGDATFNDSSYNSGTISGNAVFNYASGGIITLSGSQAWGTVTGTIKGNDAVDITTFIFNDNSQIVGSGSLTGDVTFNDFSKVSGTVVGGTIVFNNSSGVLLSGGINGNPTFNNSSTNSGSIFGNATFNDLSSNCGTISGNAVFNPASSGVITLSSSQCWGSVSGTIKGIDAIDITTFIFNDFSHVIGLGSLTGDATFNDNSYVSGMITSNAIFNDSSFISFGALVSGNVIFNDSSYVVVGGGVNGDATFNDLSYNGGFISGNAVFNYASGGIITLSGSQQWGDVAGTVKGSDAIDIITFIFNDDSNVRIGAPLNGDATFYDSSYNNGTISGDAIFNDLSGNFNTVSTNASFFDSSSNEFGTVNGSACFAATTNPNHGIVGIDLGLCLGVLSPSVNTTSNTVLSSSSADLFGEITDTGGESASETGFEYGRTTSYGTIVSQTGSFVRGAFSSVINSLSCGTYHFRAYAVNGAGTSYGSDVAFSTHVCGSVTGRGSGGGSGGGTTTLPPTITPQPTVVPPVAGCNAGDRFSTTTGLPCPSYVPPVLPIICPILKTLRIGMKGCDVLELHKKMAVLGYYTHVIDDDFGRILKAAVIKFQLANFLVGDGVVGPRTRAVLNK